MKNLIIDERIRKEEYEYLKNYFNIIKLPLSEDVYSEISGHADIFYAQIGENIICAPNAKIKEPNFIVGNKIVAKDYPNDVPYNVCKIDNKIIGSKHADTKIKVDILVKQGYTKCSILKTTEKSCITTDKIIADKLKENGIDVKYIEENNIKLLDRSGSVSKMKGFIGGAGFSFDNKLVLFGDIERLESKGIILEHLRKYKIELIDFKGLEVHDYGGVVVY